MATESAALAAFRRAALGLLTMALGMAIIVSGLARAASDAEPDVPAVNRTAEALAAHEDLLPPDGLAALQP